MPLSYMQNTTFITQLQMQQKGKAMRRQAMSRGKDKKVYTQTANKVKKINVKPKISRGGIRL